MTEEQILFSPPLSTSTPIREDGLHTEETTVHWLLDCPVPVVPFPAPNTVRDEADTTTSGSDGSGR